MPRRSTPTRLLLALSLAAVALALASSAGATVKLPAPRARAVQPYSATVAALQVRAQAGQGDSVLTALRGIRDAHPEDLTVHLAYMQVAAALGRLAELAPDYRARYEADQKSASAPFLYSLVAPDSLRDGLLAITLKRDAKFAPAFVSHGNTALRASPPDSARALTEFVKAVNADPSLLEAWVYLGYVLAGRGDSTGALTAFRGAAVVDPSWRAAGVVSGAKRLFEVGAPQSAVALLDLLPEDRPDWVDYNAAPLFVAGGEPDRAITLSNGLLAHAADPTHRAWYAYCRATLHAQMGQADSAFAWLDRAIGDGFSDTGRLASDANWGLYWRPLTNRSEYALALQKMSAVAEAATHLSDADRRQAVLSQRIDVDPGRVVLRDAATGADVPLDSFRGKVVIVDFWATWCGPCRRTMPLLSEFTKGSKKDGTVVLSAQIFERVPDAHDRAKALFKDNQYAMRLMTADDALGSQLGFNSIPTMYVVGPDGHIAYKNVGYTPTLVEELRWQVESLRAPAAKRGSRR